MDLRNYAICLWPGLPRLWIRGDFQGLIPAMTMALAFNALLVLRFIYPEWLSPSIRWGGWLLVAVWLVAVMRAAQELPRLVSPRQAAGTPDRFGEAQQAFLQANWLEAEKLFRENLRVEQRDPPALLMLACIYRKTQRMDEAAQTLDLLDSLEVGGAWLLESRAERLRLVKARHDPEETVPPQTHASTSENALDAA